MFEKKKKCERCGCSFRTARDERKLCRSCKEEIKLKHIELEVSRE